MTSPLEVPKGKLAENKEAVSRDRLEALKGAVAKNALAKLEITDELADLATDVETEAHTPATYASIVQKKEEAVLDRIAPKA